jgi:hypothetical protein
MKVVYATNAQQAKSAHITFNLYPFKYSIFLQ